MKIRISSLILIVLLTMNGCTKKQRYQNRIGGKWRLTEKTWNGTTIDLKGKTYLFDFNCTHCGEDRASYFSDSDSASAFEYVTYAFSKNGKELTMMYESKSIEKYEVKKLSSTDLELSSKQQTALYKFKKESDDD